MYSQSMQTDIKNDRYVKDKLKMQGLDQTK